MTWRVILGCLMAMGLTAPVLADEEPSEPPPYRDDRSDPVAVVQSFYNAVSRGEYARAWSYFGATKPSPSFEAFAKGYEDTDSVFVATGTPGMEGAAGSTYYSLPVAILAFGKDKTERVFAGCYTLRLANPSIQGPPFTGLSIEKAELKPAEAPYDGQVPKSCGDVPPEQVDTVLETAKKLFISAFAADCQTIRADGLLTAQPESYQISYKPSYASADDPPQTARLLRFYCGSGAYNETHVYYLSKPDEAVHELHFATPELDIRYKDGNSDETVEHLGIKGFTSEIQLVNSFYDESSQTITSAAKWRGVGDASSSGTWLFRDGAFSLVKYDVDASYDGEINPETILDYDTAP